MAVHILNWKAQINFGFIIAILLLVVLVISATTGILDLLPWVKHEAEAASLEPRAMIISRLLLEDSGYPVEWYSSNVERVGLLHYNSYSGKSVLGRLNSSKVNYVKTLSYDTVAHQLGLGNETSFRLRLSGATTLDINSSRSGGTSSVYILNRVFALDNTGFVNATLEVWE